MEEKKKGQNPNDSLKIVMEEKEKKEKETPTETPAEEQPKEPTEEPKEPEKEPEEEPKEPEEPEIDYKAELEAKTKELEQAKHKLKTHNIESKKEPEEIVLEPDEEKSIKDQVLDKATELTVGVRVNAILDTITTNEDEKALIKFEYEESIKKTGTSNESIQKDLKTARLLANASRYEKTNKELKKTAISKNTTSHAGEGGGFKPGPKDDLSKHFTKANWEFMQKRNFTRDQIKKALELQNEKS